MRLTSDAIDDRGLLDPRYTCDLDNSSPELRWDEAPEGTNSFVVLAEELDVPPRVKSLWVVYQIPPALRHLPAGIPPQDTLPNGIRQGLNGHGKLGYAGPCPPIGAAPQRYVFRLLAVRNMPSLPSRATRDVLLAAIEPHVIAEARLEGRYRRSIEQRAG